MASVDMYGVCIDRNQCLILRALCAGWVLCIAVGSYWAAVYAGTPAAAGAPPEKWTGAGAVRLAAGGPTAIVSLHPRCSCSVATLEELERAFQKARTAVRVEVLLYHPVGAGADWAEGGLAKRARLLPGSQVIPDPGGREAGRLGMESSGHIVLYGPDGRLRFSGGVTGLRGQLGDNAGETAFVAALREVTQDLPRPPVFGCSIRELNGTAKSKVTF